MKFRGLLIAAIALAALSGVLYWSNHRKPEPEKPKQAEDKAPTILDVKEPDIERVELRKKDGNVLTLERGKDKGWQIDAKPEPIRADASSVSTMLSLLAPLNAERLITAKPGDLAPFGLNQPQLQVVLTESGNKLQTLQFGDDSPSGDSAYVNVSGDPRVFTVSSSKRADFGKSLNDLRDKRLITLDPSALSQFALTAGNQTIDFGRGKQQWQILKPPAIRADAGNIDELVRQLTGATMDVTGPGADPSAAAKSFAAGKLVAVAKLTAPSGTQQLEIRKDKDDYFAKSSYVSGAYKVSRSLGESVSKKLDDFREKKVFDFGYAEPSKIEFKDPARDLICVKKQSEWYNADGKKLDADAVNGFIDKLRDLQASSFPSSGFGSPAIEITVVSDNGQKTEKISVAKSGAGYIAKRDGEAELYGLDAKTFEGLQQAAGNVKTAAAPPPLAQKK